MANRRQRIDVNVKDDGLRVSPSLDFDLGSLAPGPKTPATDKKTPPDARRGRGERVEVRRVKAGRGGKTVTEVRGFSSSVSNAAKDEWFVTLKRQLGCGGTRTGDGFELQGDRVSELLEIFKSKGLRPVRTGG